LDFTPDAARGLINGYCKEAGVRNLVRKTNKIFQKMALQYVKKISFEKVIKAENLKNYLGLPTFYDARLFANAPPSGVMVGLAYNDYGGSIMYIECANQGKAPTEV
jgi:ATP-dependent Lon protease